MPRGRRGRSATAPSFVDRGYHVSTGKRFYHMPTQHDLAELTQQRELLEKLAAYFEVDVDALNDMSKRYIMGFDLHLIADKMLDSFNQYRQTGDERLLENARRHVAILSVNVEVFPSLLKRCRTAVI